MTAAHAFLQDLALVVGIAAVTSLGTRALKLPPVLGYLSAGLLIGPYVPVPLYADPGRIHTLSELGVLLVMFGIGLEFSLRNLAKVIPRAGLACAVQTSAMIAAGWLAGSILGWSPAASLVAGASLAISSTMIVSRVFAQERVAGPVAELALGVLVVQDLVAVLLLAVLTPMAAGSSLSAGELGVVLLKLGAFLVGTTTVGFLIVPRLMRRVVHTKNDELILLWSLGIAFAFSYAASEAGYSVALGAFIAGSLVCESGHGHAVMNLVKPLRDVFAAIFFVSIGMSVDPSLVLSNLPLIGVFTVIVIVGQSLAVSAGALLAGYDLKTSVQAGLGLAQIGEFSFVLAGLAAGLGAPAVYPVIVSVAVLTAVTTPFLVRWSPRIASWVDRRLPNRMQNFFALYGGWIERSREAQRGGALRPTRALRKLIGQLALDGVVLAAIVIGVSIGDPHVTAFLGAQGLSETVAELAWAASGLVVSLPFLFGLVRSTRALGSLLAGWSFEGTPVTNEQSASRRLLAVTLQLAVALVVGGPLVALTQPFLPPFVGVATLVVVLVALAVGFWRRAANLEKEMRTGAHDVVEAILRRGAPDHSHESQETGEARGALLESITSLGNLSEVRLRPAMSAVGKTLADIDLRAQTGATVIAIVREPTKEHAPPVLVPSGREVLLAGDVLILAGGDDSLDAARSWLSVHA